jgi:hypothetical protein
MCNNASVAKNVTNLTIIGENWKRVLALEEVRIINGGTVSIPLQTDVGVTTFRFILNFGNQNPAVVNERYY